MKIFKDNYLFENTGLTEKQKNCKHEWNLLTFTNECIECFFLVIITKKSFTIEYMHCPKCGASSAVEVKI